MNSFRPQLADCAGDMALLDLQPGDAVLACAVP